MFVACVRGEYSKPLSECTKGRITGYDEYEKNGACSFGVPTMYGAAPNEAFYDMGNKCGVCYELVGPQTVIKFMVDSHCPVKGNERMCSGDMYHFDLHKNAFKEVFGANAGVANVSFRMVSCGHGKNMIIHTVKEVGEYYFSFVVMYHEIGLRKVYYSYDEKNWTRIDREGNYNRWSIHEKIQLPLHFILEPIAGENVTTATIQEIKKSHDYDTGVQFKVPNEFFDVMTLKETEKKNEEECCKLPDDFTNIYDVNLMVYGKTGPSAQ